jgi:acetyl esterase/lipase
MGSSCERSINHVAAVGPYGGSFNPNAGHRGPDRAHCTRNEIKGHIFMRLLVLACAIASLAPVMSPRAAPASSDVVYKTVVAPLEDRDAIAIGTHTDNPEPESWMRIVGKMGSASPWWIQTPIGELVVRNVSQAAITPFLPAPAKATGAAMIIAPGGGTLTLGMEQQGYDIARWLNGKGIAAFVLKYRLVPTPKNQDAFLEMVGRPMPVYSDVISPQQSMEEEAATREDGFEAVRYVREHAQRWGLSVDRIGFMGFSAGAYTTLGVALKADDPSRPNLAACIYGVMSGVRGVPSSAPPLFIAASTDDPLMDSSGAKSFVDTYLAWRQAHIPVEFHMFDIQAPSSRSGHIHRQLCQPRLSGLHAGGDSSQ